MPDEVKNLPVNTAGLAVAIMHGLEVGLTPMAALQSIAVVNGMPTIWGDGALGLVQASGLLEDIEETVDAGTDGVPLAAKCRVKRRDRKQWVEQTFTQVEAKKAGLWSKAGPWTQYPRRMMQMRARSWALRDAFPDVLRGLGVREEVGDMVDVTERGSHTMAPPPEPQRADFKAQTPVTDVEDHPSSGNGPATAGAGDASGGPADPHNPPPPPPEVPEPRDWRVSGNSVAERLEGIVTAYAAAESAADIRDIEDQNAALLKGWAAGKPGSPYARAHEAAEAAKQERAAALAG
jgi:hypothetical protein